MKTSLKIASSCLFVSGILFAGSIAYGDTNGKSTPASHGAAPTAKDEPKPAASPTAAPAKTEEKVTGPTPDEVIETLRSGNRRYASGDSLHPRNDQDRRSETYAGGQHPIVSLLSCADSRVPPELIFDSGIGDLFVIRIAGNVADTDEIATIEYGVGHLHTPLIMVMGHTKCGAVAAVVDGAKLHGNLAALVDNIQAPAATVKDANPGLKGQTLNNKVIRANVFQSMQDLLEQSEEVRELVEAKKVKIVGAVYDINSGFIDWLGEHPRQEEILSSPLKEKTKHDGELTADDHADDHNDAHTPKSTKSHAAPAKKDAHTSAKDGHSSAAKKNIADKNPDAKTTQASALKTYGPLSAFVIGSLALSAVFLHLVRR